jgi:trk system potassium uptake protein TrkH
LYTGENNYTGGGHLIKRLLSKFKQWNFSSSRLILLSFLFLILVGSLLLMLPISSRERIFTPFPDALFTAASASCVTGLVVRDTATYWSLFGKLVILAMIQIGGLGTMTLAILFVKLSGRRIGLKGRATMQSAISAPHVGGIVKLTSFIVKVTIVVESAGACLMMPVFIKEFGRWKGFAVSFFHSISAFCNAGFDLMGERQPFSSMTAFQDNWTVNLTLTALILIGGIGFLTWDDIRNYRLRLRFYSTQSKIILSASVFLIGLPFLYFFFTEFRTLPSGERFLSSLFHAVTPRTAGFNTADFTEFSDGGIAVTIILMLIGGAPGSTAGGMKITTVSVMMISMMSVFFREKEAAAFHRRISSDVLRSANAVFWLDVILFAAGSLSICHLEGVPLRAAMFESASAVATVGLTLGITPQLGLLSKLMLTVMMFFGRVGGLTLIFAAVAPKKRGNAKYPADTVTVG